MIIRKNKFHRSKSGAVPNEPCVPREPQVADSCARPISMAKWFLACCIAEDQTVFHG